jgi:hypothetical protein
MRRFCQQSGSLHDLPALAVAALRHLFCDPSNLHRMRSIVRQAFDSRDCFIAYR